MPEEKQSQYNAFPEFEDSGGDGGDDFGELKAERQLSSYFDRKRKGTGLGKQAEARLINLLLQLPEPTDHVKLADMDLAKRAEIIKRIQSHFHRALPSLNQEEPKFDRDMLDEMGQCPRSALAGAGSLGMVLSPPEFQRMSLSSAGHQDLADELEEKGCCFRPHCGPPVDMFPFNPRDSSSNFVDEMTPLIEGRSGLFPPLRRRVVRIVILGQNPPEPPEIDHPCMSQLAAGYAGYRRRLLQQLPRLIQFALRDRPALLHHIFGPDDPGNESHPLADQRQGVLQSLFGMLPSIYFNRAHLPGPVSEFLEKHPSTSGLEREQLLAD